MATVLCVILNWRSAEMTFRAVQAAHEAMQGIPGAINVVDNDSGDGSFEQLSQAVAARDWGAVSVRVMQAGRNGGFGAGNNFGIRAGMPQGHPPADYVYIQNSDAFPEPDAIRALLDHLETHPATGFAGSFIFGEDGTPHRTAFRFPSVAGEFEAALRFGPVSRWLSDHIVAMDIPVATTRVDWLAGASVMMRASVLERIGLFDETFFLYFEETDLCLRAARAGWPTDYVPASRVMHIGSASTGMKEWSRIPRFWLDSRRHFFVKNHGRAGFAAATAAHVAGGLLWRLRLVFQRKDRGDPPHFLRDLIRHSLSPAGESGRSDPSTVMSVLAPKGATRPDRARRN